MRQISREVENTVDIENLESELLDALVFEATVISAKVELEMKTTESRTNPQARVVPIKTRARSEL